MKADNRRVYLFIALGLIAAVFVGVAVWHTGSPANPSSSDTATATPEVSTVAEASRTTTTTPSSEEESTEKKPQNVATPVDGDPFLPPHAVVQQNPQPIVPTTVYRPPNVQGSSTTEPSVAPESPATTSSPAPTSPSPTSENPGTSVPSESTDTPQVPQFTEPATPSPEPAEAPTTSESEPERAGMPPTTGVPRQPLPWPFNLWF
ncbi:hypothetical protein GCM10027031_04010 [Corynebacterium atrinae]